VLIALGVWQLERKAWKENLIATLAERMAAPPSAVPPRGQWPNLDQARDEFRRATVRGAFTPGREARVYSGGAGLRDDVKGPGYFAFSPARLPDGSAVVVNRGYVDNPNPDASLTPIALPEAAVAIVGALRWPDEFVRHKTLDCVGDLALAGGRIRARIVAHRPSHRGTIKLVRALLRQATKETCVLGIEEIMKVIPHRYPFLLVDRILELEPGQRVVGLKNVTINEPFFDGHFPGHPIMPGVLIIEAMAQVGGMLLMGSIEVPENKVVYFVSLDGVKWRKPVKPGDQLRFELEVVQVRGIVCKMRGIAKVDGEVVAEAGEMVAMLRDK